MSKLYQIRHVTRYRYETDISENVMEVRKCPLSRPSQRCLSFSMKVEPAVNVFQFQEYVGNVVHHFDIPQSHREMTVTAESLVEIKDVFIAPETVGQGAWEAFAQLEEDGEFLEYSLPSPSIQPTEVLADFYESVRPRDGEDPVAFLRRLNHKIATDFAYVPLSTQVDSSIDEAIASKQGVCQDFAHIMVGVARMANIPTRYVSGYLFHRHDHGDRSVDDATHAWVEAYIPELGWIGFDPTNDILATDRHIVTCVGRDYKDVPPTRGVYRGQCASELSVAVQVHPADAVPIDDEFRRMPESDLNSEDWLTTQQQLQQEMAAQQ